MELHAITQRQIGSTLAKKAQQLSDAIIFGQVDDTLCEELSSLYEESKVQKLLYVVTQKDH